MYKRQVVSWGPWTRLPSNLSPEEFEPKREELNAAIEYARLRALDHFKKAHFKKAHVKKASE